MQIDPVQPQLPLSNLQQVDAPSRSVPRFGENVVVYETSNPKGISALAHGGRYHLIDPGAGLVGVKNPAFVLHDIPIQPASDLAVYFWDGERRCTEVIEAVAIKC